VEILSWQFLDDVVVEEGIELGIRVLGFDNERRIRTVATKDEGTNARGLAYLNRKLTYILDIISDIVTDIYCKVVNIWLRIVLFERNVYRFIVRFARSLHT
jgi:hypothetical protein